MRDSGPRCAGDSNQEPVYVEQIDDPISGELLPEPPDGPNNDPNGALDV